MDSFTWKGRNSYDYYGIVINIKPPLIKPERNVNEIAIPGRDGDLTIDYGTYKPIIFSMTCTFLNTVTGITIDDIMTWLDGYDNLTLSWQSDRSYKAKLINKIDIEQSLITFGEFPLIFKAQPFGYTTSNPLNTFTTTPTSIFNSCTKDSRPVIKVYGNGTIILTVNTTNITLNSVVDYVTVDSDLMDCYKDTVLQNNNMIGGFPVLAVGTNNISWSSGVVQIETATVVGTITTAGNATVIVTAVGVTGSPITYSVAVALSDTATLVAGKIITVLQADANLTAVYTVGGTGANITLTRKTPASNDTTLNINIANGTCAGLTASPTSANTTAGVAPVSKIEITPNWRYL